MNMDNDFDWNLAPSGIIYGARAVKLDPTTANACLLGSKNSMCVGVTPQQSEFAPGMIGNTTFPMVLGQPNDPNLAAGSVANIPVYGPGRNALIDIDPNFAGQVAPNDLIESSDSGYGTKAQPTGAFNRWIVGISRSFANGGQSCNVKIVIFPWAPTGS